MENFSNKQQTSRLTSVIAFHVRPQMRLVHEKVTAQITPKLFDIQMPFEMRPQVRADFEPHPTF